MFRENLILSSDSRSYCLHKIHYWASKKDKSFNISKIIRYNYSVVTAKRNYFTVEVEYFTRKKEGKYQLGYFSWVNHCMNKNRFQLIKN